MALINCRECKHEISDGAGRCPRCGCKVKAPQPIEYRLGEFLRNHPSRQYPLLAKAGAVLVGIILLMSLVYVANKMDERFVEKAREAGRAEADGKRR